MTEPVIERIPEDPDNPFRLGRGIFHDPASRAFAFAERREAAVPVVSRGRWPTQLPILDQGSLGSCVPNTGVERLAFTDAQRPGLSAVAYSPRTLNLTSRGNPLRKLDESLAVDWYRDVTRLDPFPGQWEPDDTGSDGTSLGKLLKSLGLIDSYSHAFGGLPDVLAALMSGPVPVGVSWYDSMFRPDRDGFLTISPNAQVAGGHEFNLDGEVDVEQQWVGMTNHWVNPDGTPWGIMGRARLSFALLDRLLAEDGDATVMHTVPAVAPAPGPGPVSPPQFLPALSDQARARMASRARKRHMTVEQWVTRLVENETK